MEQPVSSARTFSCETETHSTFRSHKHFFWPGRSTVLISMADCPFMLVDGGTIHAGTEMRSWAAVTIPLHTFKLKPM